MTAVTQTREQRRMLELQAALAAWHEMNTDKQWARLTADEHLVIIDYGVIHPDGFEESAIGTRLFVAKSDWIVVVESIHHG